jgi:hypothetical protein
MAKDYEKYKIPVELVYDGFENIPSFALRVGQLNCDSKSFTLFNGFTTTEFRYWLALDKWTPIEAALVLSGINPQDDEIYLIDSSMSEKDSFIWKYYEEFSVAKRIYFQFSRNDDFSCGASPSEWIRYYVNKLNIIDPVKTTQSIEKNLKMPISLTNVVWESIKWLEMQGDKSLIEKNDASVTSEPNAYPNAIQFQKQGYLHFWKNVDREDKSTHPRSSVVIHWFEKKGLSAVQAKYAAAFIRPDWAAIGRPPVKK